MFFPLWTSTTKISKFEAPTKKLKALRKKKIPRFITSLLSIFLIGSLVWPDNPFEMALERGKLTYESPCRHMRSVWMTHGTNEERRSNVVHEPAAHTEVYRWRVKRFSTRWDNSTARQRWFGQTRWREWVEVVCSLYRRIWRDAETCVKFPDSANQRNDGNWKYDFRYSYNDFDFDEVYNYEINGENMPKADGCTATYVCMCNALCTYIDIMYIEWVYTRRRRVEHAIWRFFDVLGASK